MHTELSSNKARRFLSSSHVLMVMLGHHSEMIIYTLHGSIQSQLHRGDCQIKLDLYDPAEAFQHYVPLLSITFPKSPCDKAEGNSHSNLPFPEHLLRATLLLSFKTHYIPRSQHFSILLRKCQPSLICPGQSRVEAWIQTRV